MESAVDRAVKVFVHGFAFTRSFTHPYLVEQLQSGVWLLRDAPRVRGDYRVEEYIALGSDASAMDQLARDHTRGRFRICVIRAIDESDEPIRANFQTLGYRLMATEPLMLHQLTELVPINEPCPIDKVTTQAQADLLAKAAGSRQILAEHLTADPALVRVYMALDESTPVGWVSSVAVDDCAWCTNLFVVATHRRQGIARALLRRMLTDDKAAGAQASILLSSHSGAKFYPTVGYETVGELLMYTPSRHTPTP